MGQDFLDIQYLQGKYISLERHKGLEGLAAHVARKLVPLVHLLYTAGLPLDKIPPKNGIKSMV